MRITPVLNCLLVLAIFTLFGCEKTVDGNMQINDEKYFYEEVEVEKPQIKYALGDTLWISGSFNEPLTDTRTDELISLENETFIVRTYVNLLLGKFDSLNFIDQNFDLIEDKGDIQLINVINLNQESYTFDIKIGKPQASNDFRVGLVLNYPGIFASELNAWVYYGPDRLDYTDFSSKNSKGYIDLSFVNDSVNDSIYYALPTSLRQYYANYYNSVKVASKKFYFFEIDSQ